MTQDELTKIHLSAPMRYGIDSPDIDAALREADLDPDDPSGYTREQAMRAIREFVAQMGPTRERLR